ncbi:MAG: PIN domain-containing protein [Candidatus Hadarchaeota archaeon]
MFYCDSNLLIYPAIYSDEKATAAEKILRAMARGDVNCLTCALTIDEVLWIVWKLRGKEKAVEQAGRLLELPNLKIVDTSVLS